MLALRCNKDQLNYIYYIATFYACCSADSYDQLYIYLGQALQQKINKLLIKNKLTYKLKLSNIETILFNEIISAYLDSIKLDQRLIWEKRYLNQLCYESRIQRNEQHN
jgi:hypothetical protein